MVDEMYNKETCYDLDRAVEIVKEAASAKFDETVDLAIGLNVDPRHAEENIRINTSLPNGTGKEVVVLVLAQGPKVQEALDAGADFCGNKDYLDKIKAGWVDFDKIVATPDMMPELGKLGKILLWRLPKRFRISRLVWLSLELKKPVLFIPHAEKFLLSKTR